MVAMSLLVFAGSAQLAVLPLMSSGAPLWVVFATGFCVNLRFLIFSAQWRNYFGHLPLRQRLSMMYIAGDLTFVHFTRRFPEPQPGPGQVEYYWGAVSVNWMVWQAASIVGILAADRIPTHWGLGFAGVLALLGLAYSLLNERVLWAVAGVAAVVSVAAYSLPFKLNIVAAIVVAGVVGWLLDQRMAQAKRKLP
jgi:predicted branched-subunit amino acid permease